MFCSAHMTISQWWCYLHPTTNPLFMSGLGTGTGTIFGSCGEVLGCAWSRSLDL